jgi:hypothetical protein
MLIDRWVSEMDGAARVVIMARLRDNDADSPRSAFYELAIGQVLRTMGDVRYEPENLPCQGRPDWLVTTANKAVVVEVATREEFATLEERRRKAILCEVAELTGPWWVVSRLAPIARD